MIDMERLFCAVARVYRTINQPILRSKIDMTHDIYADEDATDPSLTVHVKGEPRVKLLDLVVFGSALVIFMSAVSGILRFFRRHS